MTCRHAIGAALPAAFARLHARAGTLLLQAAVIRKASLLAVHGLSPRMARSTVRGKLENSEMKVGSAEAIVWHYGS